MLKQQPSALREGVEEVCVDMWGGFPKVIREVFPNAQIADATTRRSPPHVLRQAVIDRFHVQKLVNKASNKIRLTLKLKGLKNRCLLMNNQANLTDEEQEQLELLLKYSPSLKIAHELKEELITIYNSDISASGGIRQIKKWLTSARILFGSAADPICSHIDEICNYFNNRTKAWSYRRN